MINFFIKFSLNCNIFFPFYNRSRWQNRVRYRSGTSFWKLPTVDATPSWRAFNQSTNGVTAAADNAVSRSKSHTETWDCTWPGLSITAWNHGRFCTVLVKDTCWFSRPGTTDGRQGINDFQKQSLGSGTCHAAVLARVAKQFAKTRRSRIHWTD